MVNLKLGGLANTSEGGNKLLRYLDKLRKLAEINQIQSNKEKHADVTKVRMIKCQK